MNDEDQKQPELTLEQRVWQQLKLCYDPEIPVNIVDLGLIYGVNIQSLSDDNNIANIRMTLTSPGCAMGNYIVDEVRCRVASIPRITQVNVEMVFEPPWNRSMMSAEAKLALGIM